MSLISKFRTLLESCEKNPLKSKTLWVNGLSLVAGILTLVYGTASPEWAIAVLAGVNILLRFVTTSGVVPKDEDGETVLDNVNDILKLVENKDITGTDEDGETILENAKDAYTLVKQVVQEELAKLTSEKAEKDVE